MKNKGGLIVYLIIGSLVGFLIGFPPSLAYMRQTVTASVGRVSEVFVKQPATPQRLIIPVLSVNAPIESVGKDAKGLMAIPKNVYNAGWYESGIKPGEKGNAVIDGHLNTRTLAPSIFWNLGKMRPGDMITIVDADNQTWNFRVTETTDFPDATFPVSLVFGPTDKTRLNLITCSGYWQTDLQNYSHRTVVFSELIR